eukprot:Gb_03022 [translate_table: standard]
MVLNTELQTNPFLGSSKYNLVTNGLEETGGVSDRGQKACGGLYSIVGERRYFDPQRFGFDFVSSTITKANSVYNPLSFLVGSCVGGAPVSSNLPREGGVFPVLSVSGVGVPKEGSEDARSGAICREGTSRPISGTTGGGEGSDGLDFGILEAFARIRANILCTLKELASLCFRHGFGCFGNLQAILVMAFLPFASKEVGFKEIGNALGSFVEEDMLFQHTGSMTIARIFVSLDLREGLAKNMVLQKGTHSFVQTLDYVGVPFRCNRCHIYGHLVAECSLSFKRRVWVKKSQSSPNVEKAAVGVERHPGTDEEVRLEAERALEGTGGDIVPPDGLQKFPARMLDDEGGLDSSCPVAGGDASSSLQNSANSRDWVKGYLVVGDGEGLVSVEKVSSSPDLGTSSDTEEKEIIYNLRSHKVSLSGANGGALGGLGWNEGTGPKSLESGRKSYLHLAQARAVSEVGAGRQLSIVGETLCVGGKVMDDLTEMFGGWIFMSVDARGRSGGLITGWRSRSLKLSNSWSVDLGLGIELYSQDLLQRASFVEYLCSETWGPNAQVDILSDFFLKKLEDVGVILDHFLVVLELAEVGKRPSSPFKFIPGWLEEDEFVRLARDLWVPYNENLRESASLQFAANLKKLKQATIGWAHTKKIKEAKELFEVESKLEVLYVSEGVGYLSEESKAEMTTLEQRRRKLLDEKEAAWRLKSRALLLSKGDENSKVFHQHANHRKNVNTIWKINREDRVEVTNFEDLARAGVSHFGKIFKAEERVSIAEVVRLTSFFPSFVNEAENLSLLKEVSKEEVQAVLHSLQKEKRPGPDGWPVEFFMGFYDTVERDLLKVVEETRAHGKVLASFNTTFITLIPKADNPSSFEEYRPILLCNCIYKIVSKVIAMRVKKLLSKSISGEQFGFVEGRQIHEAIGVAQEGLHSIKTRRLKAVVAKIDLSKTHDRVSWLYLRMMLIHIGFCVPFVNWVMSCVSTVSFEVLINGAASVAEGLSRAIIDAKRTRRDMEKLKEILELFCVATGMLDWKLLIDKFEKRISVWCYRWLSRGGHQVLVKSVLEALPVYRMSLSWIPKGILEQLRRINFRFLWSGCWEKRDIPLPKSVWRLLQGKGLWCKVVQQKYVSPDTVEECIRKPQINSHNVSVIWKAVVKAFPSIKFGLVWKVGNGASVADPTRTSVWSQGWIRAGSTNFRGEDAQTWGIFVDRLKSSHVRLTENEDKLIWAKNPSALTWDNLQKRNIAGPGRCPLCKTSEETNNHLIMECSFSIQVWREIEHLLGVRNVWIGASVEEGLRTWCGNPIAKTFLALPVILAWGICVARNASIFEDRGSSPFQCAAQGLSILKSFPQVKQDKSPRHIVTEYVNRDGAWAFFDGAAQGDPQICGAGGILYINDFHIIKYRAGLGEGINNYAEPMAIKLVLLLAGEKGVTRMQVFGDILNVIKWMRKQ